MKNRDYPKVCVTAVNNSNKIYPHMYLTPEEIRIEEHIILHICTSGYAGLQTQWENL